MQGGTTRISTPDPLTPRSPAEHTGLVEGDRGHASHRRGMYVVVQQGPQSTSTNRLSFLFQDVRKFEKFETYEKGSGRLTGP